MPQKRNPDIFELVRAHASEVAGTYLGAVVSTIGLPLSYHRDLQQTKRLIVTSCERSLAALDAFARAFDDTAFVRERMTQHAADGYTVATDIADALIARGVSARSAHAFVGSAVRAAEDEGRALHDGDLREIAEKAGLAPFDAPLDARASVDAKATAGSTSPAAVRTSAGGAARMTRVHVWGASGYAAAEAIRILDRHPLLEIGALESRSHAGALLADHFPLLRRTSYRFDGSGSVRDAVRAGDIVIAAAAHGEAREQVPALLERGARVVDLSADYRFDDEAVYGLSEFHAREIAGAALVANPGCYPTASLLALLPLFALAEAPRQAIVDAKSGITGAGRNPAVGSLYAEVAGDIRAYGLGGHRHQPEIERILGMHDAAIPLIFTPHVVPLARGMLADCYAIFDRAPDAAAVAQAYERAYGGSPFVRMLEGERAPSVSAVVGTNDAEIRFDVLGTTVRAICAIDNLGKGAAGQAVQNINLMLGFPMETGLDAPAVVA